MKFFKLLIKHKLHKNSKTNLEYEYFRKFVEPLEVFYSFIFPGRDHVLSVTLSEGDVVPPHLFQKGKNVKQSSYVFKESTIVKIRSH